MALHRGSAAIMMAAEAVAVPWQRSGFTLCLGRHHLLAHAKMCASVWWRGTSRFYPDHPAHYSRSLRQSDDVQEQTALQYLLAHLAFINSFPLLCAYFWFCLIVQDSRDILWFLHKETLFPFRAPLFNLKMSSILHANLSMHAQNNRACVWTVFVSSCNSQPGHALHGMDQQSEVEARCMNMQFCCHREQPRLCL